MNEESTLLYATFLELFIGMLFTYNCRRLLKTLDIFGNSSYFVYLNICI